MDRNWILASALTLLIAGCAGNAPPGTAMSLLPAADAAATAWAPDAQLVTAAAIEGDWHGTDWADAPSGMDGTIGDGRALYWEFEFMSLDQDELLTLVIAANGTVMAQDTSGLADERPIEEVRVNSDEAAATARAENADFARSMDAGVLYALGQDDEFENAVWAIMADQGFVLVDAVTGDVVFSMGDDWGTDYDDWQDWA